MEGMLKPGTFSGKTVVITGGGHRAGPVDRKISSGVGRQSGDYESEERGA